MFSGRRCLIAPKLSWDRVSLVVEAKRTSPGDQYIQSISFNGKPHTKLWFHHADITNGATIVFSMGPKPSQQFGAGEDALPPSLTL